VFLLHGFTCSSCVEGTGREEKMKGMDIEQVGKLEYVNKFCYLGDIIGFDGGAEE
jgi:hypothetical protein